MIISLILQIDYLRHVAGEVTHVNLGRKPRQIWEIQVLFQSLNPEYYLLDAAYFMWVTQYTATKLTANLDWILRTGKKERQAGRQDWSFQIQRSVYWQRWCYDFWA